MTDQNTKLENQVIADLATAATRPWETEIPGIYLVRDETGRPQVVDVEQHQYIPRRLRGIVLPHTLASFVEYATRHRDGGTTVWVDQVAFKIVAVLNDHEPDQGRWGDHRAVLQLLKTPEWEHWTSQDGKYLDQNTFAEHLQDGIMEIVDPDGATLLEVAQTIQGKTKVDWKQATRLDNGEIQLGYHEEIQATAGRSGQLEIPSQLVLAISPFYGERPHTITARLRYRIREGNLTIGYKLDRPHEILTGAVADIARRLRDEHGFANVYLGTPRG